MNIVNLWIDDVRPMPESFNAHARNWYAAKEIIDSAIFKSCTLASVSFDHDLGHGPSGYDIACIIEAAAANGQLPRVDWEVHSMNPVGAARIRTAMANADRYWAEHDGRHYRTGQ